MILVSKSMKSHCGILILLGWGFAAAVSGEPARGDDRGPAQAGVSRVSGRVVVVGAVAPAKPLPVFKNRKFCGSEVLNETLLLSPGGGLHNAAVMLQPVDRRPAVPKDRVVLDNRQCRFVPHLQIAHLGSELILQNSDPILHTVHARIGRETLFNIGLPWWRQVSKPLDRAGIMRIDCDVLHTWMSAVIIVTETPYHAVSGVDGNFAITGLPAGDYEMHVWHERLGRKVARIKLGADTVHNVEVVYVAGK